MIFTRPKFFTFPRKHSKTASCPPGRLAGKKASFVYSHTWLLGFIAPVFLQIGQNYYSAPLLQLSLPTDFFRDALPIIILVTLVILFIIAINTFGKRESFLEAQVKERTRQINLKNQQIMAQSEELNREKEKVEKSNSELVTMLNKLESTIEAMNSQRNLLEDTNRKVIDSIRYAKRIQRAILPQHESVTEFFPQSFVFYQAKDIVSGDFYFSTKKMGKNFLGVVDCTGHGVPGAFMSLIAHQQLTRAINEYGILEPARILHWAEKGLSGMLNRGIDAAEANDGMEVALISADPRRGILEYSGAHRPLYRIHKGELIEYRGEPFSIGPVQQTMELEKRFINHQIQMEEGDMYYMFSDGYVSQFSSKTGKKYMTGRFKDFLLSISKLPVEDQKQMLWQEYERWRGDSTQMDDMLVLGFRIDASVMPKTEATTTEADLDALARSMAKTPGA